MAGTSGSHQLGAVTLSDGSVLPDMRINYRTYGELNARRDNVILFPTWFASRDMANEWIIGDDRALDPRRHFIVVVNIFGNGVSSSPSNTPAPFRGPHFPFISITDNVLLQHRLLREKFGVDQLALVVGRSMGAQMAFAWGAQFPAQVRAILPFVGSAKTSVHNSIFLENVKLSIMSDPAWADGHYTARPSVALKRMQLVFDAWGFSQAFYRQKHHLRMGFQTTDEFLARPPPSDIDANDLLAQVATWQRADISTGSRYGGNLAQALGCITARAIVMPCRTDLYFPPEDSALEVALMPRAELRVLESVWGHRAGSPGSDPADIRFLEAAILELLAD